MEKIKLINFLNSLTLITSTSNLIFKETIQSSILSSVSDHSGSLPPATSFDFINNRGDPTFIQGNFGNSEVDIIVGFNENAVKVRQLLSPVPSRDGFGASVAFVSYSLILI